MTKAYLKLLCQYGNRPSAIVLDRKLANSLTLAVEQYSNMDSYCTLSVLMGMPDPRVENLNKFKLHDNPKPNSGGKSLVGFKVTIPNNRSGDKKRPSSSFEDGRCNHCGKKES